MKRTKENTFKDRRYKEGEFAAYDIAYKQALNDSPILNPDRRHLGNEYLRDSETALLELEGDPTKDNYYQMSGSWKLGLIPMFKNELKDIHNQFKAWQNQMVKRGNAIERPKEYPEPLLNLKLKTEALLDVRQKEARSIKNQIAEREALKEIERIRKILPQGPLGKLDGNSAVEKEKLNSIDGQLLGLNAKGIPYIKEPKSPYFGMSLYHYKEMSKAWIKEQGLDNESLFQERERLFIEQIKQAEKEGRVLTVNSIGIKALKREKLSRITKEQFPKWDKNIKPINEI